MQWIPTSARLPQLSDGVGPFLITLNTPNAPSVQAYVVMAYYANYQWTDVGDGYPYSRRDVTAWMPKPKPYVP